MSYGFNEGVLRSTTQPLVDSGRSWVSTMTNVLGLSNHKFPHNPVNETPAETMPIQRALEGKNNHIPATLISMMVSANPVLLQLFPVKRTNTLTTEFETLDFPKEFALETAPGSAPAYPTFATGKRSVTCSMYQFGATTTFQELRHAEGLTIWYGKLITMCNAFIEIAEMSVVQALLEVPSYFAEYFIKTGLHEIDLARAGRMHDLFFDVLRRRQNGFAELVNAVRDDMQNSASIVPTDMLIGVGIAGLAITKLHTEFYRNGPGAAENAVKLTDAFPEVYDGIRVIKVRPLNYREKLLKINLLERQLETGQFFAIDHFHSSALLGSYNTNWLTIGFFSMDTDDWDYIGIQKAIHHSGRFHKGDGRLVKYHHTLAADARNICGKIGVPFTNQVDMFIYDAGRGAQGNNFRVTTVFGQMEDWALTDATVKHTSITIENYLRRTVNKEGFDALEAISTGLDAIAELYEKRLDEDDTNFLKAALAQGNGLFGVPELTNALIGTRKAYRPAGYGTAAGFFEIAKANSESKGGQNDGFIDPVLVRVAQQFVKASKRFYHALRVLFPCDHIVLDPKSAPLAFEPSTPSGVSANEHKAIISLFHNIVDSNKLTLAYKGAVRNKAPLPLADLSARKFGWLPPALAHAPEGLYNRFTDQIELDKLAASFKTSLFGQRYSEYKNRSRAGGRGSRVVASSDVDNTAIAPLKFAQFLENELLEDKPYQNARLLARVTAAVDRPDTTPVEINDDALNALRGPEGLLQGETPVPDGSQKASAGLAVSAAELKRADVVGMEFTSPYNTSGTMSAVDAAKVDSSLRNDNILRTAFHVQSRSGARSMQSQQFSPANLPPVFAQSLLTEPIAGELLINDTIAGRFKAAAADQNWLLRVAQQMLILAPICLQNLDAMCDYNVLPPVAIVLEQPFRMYRTSTVIFLSRPSASSIGNVLIFDPDTTTGYDAIGKRLMVNTTIYMGAIAPDCKNWYVAHDVAVVGYDGGENAKMFDLGRERLFDNLHLLSRDGPSILPFMVPAGSCIGKNPHVRVPPHHNIRGFRSAAYYQANSRDRDMEYMNKPMHPSAAFYTGLQALYKLGMTGEWKFHKSRTAHNTETHQGLTLIFNPHTGQHDRVILPQDVFGTAVHPKCAENRLSTVVSDYKEMNYEQRTFTISA